VPIEQIVVTNAHVVAGVDEIRIDTADGGRVLGEVIGYDPAADLAVILVPELDAEPIPLGPTPGRGEMGEVLGFAPDADPPITPYRIAGEVTATGRDIYGEGDVRRQVLYVAAELDAGDSGAPLVSDGAVVGMVFAVAPGTEPLAFALTPDELGLPPMDEGVPADTGECR
jgi:S1-C subfamily serine protease